MIQIETFELSNILIGGLFAVIALNFTISVDHPMLVNGDNAVTRLLALNYLCLAVNLVINVAVFRFDLIGRFFGKHVLTQVFRYLTWALPLCVLSTAAAIILVARAWCYSRPWLGCHCSGFPLPGPSPSARGRGRRRLHFARAGWNG